MKIQYMFFALLCFTIVGFSSCDKTKCVKGDGTSVTNTLTLATVTGIDMQINADVTLIQGPEQSITVEAEQNIFDLLNTNVNADGVWEIRFNDFSCVRNHLPIKITITAINIEDVTLSASGDVTTQSGSTFSNTTSTLDLSGSGNITYNASNTTSIVRLSGSGNISMANTSTTTNVNLTGSGNITLNGTSINLTPFLSGSGNISAYELVADSVTAELSGSGNIEVTANTKLDASITGSGNVYYRGNPTDLSSVILGSGNVIDAN
ncbi:MAG: DUF2807 domain-containing protein [Saprospiraceae bacterium]|nr:DUF2807 domain-containing protein [Saprospiraceae bacterium]